MKEAKILFTFFKNNQLIGNNGPMKIWLVLCYILLWVHNIDVICISYQQENCSISLQKERFPRCWCIDCKLLLIFVDSRLCTSSKLIVLNFCINLFSVPNVKIYGDRDLFVKSSSTVQLRCVVSQSLVPPTYIEWRHNNHHLPLATSALSVGSQKGARLQTTPPEHIAAGTTVSTLTILEAEMSDSGKYTCLPAQLEAASVNLHVLESKYSPFHLIGAASRSDRLLRATWAKTVALMWLAAVDLDAAPLKWSPLVQTAQTLTIL